MKKKWPLSIATIINIGFIAFIVSRIKDHFDLNLLIENLGRVSAPLMVLVAILNMIVLFFYGKRLSSLIDRDNLTGFAIASVGNAANNLLPFRLGEIFRVYFARTKFGVLAIQSLLAVFFERMSDLFSVICLGIIIFLTTASRLFLDLRLLVFGFSVAFAIGMVAIILNSKKLVFFLNRWMHKHHTVSWLCHFKDLFTQKKMRPLFLFTLLIWIFTVGSFFVFFKGALTPISFFLVDAICLTLLTTLSLAFSALPGNIGLFEAGIVYYLTEVKNVDQNMALALALVFHLLVAIPQIVCLIYFLVAKFKDKQVFQ